MSTSSSARASPDSSPPPPHHATRVGTRPLSPSVELPANRQDSPGTQRSSSTNSTSAPRDAASSWVLWGKASDAHLSEPRVARRLDPRASPKSPLRTRRPHSANISGFRSSTNSSRGRSHSPAAAPALILSTAGQRQTPRKTRSRTPVTVTTAEAVRTACDFSMDVYRALHQRNFKSAHEELDFLRRDFVASRKTLALVRDENLRLERELLERAAEVSRLVSSLEEMRREADLQRLSTQQGRTTGSSNNDLGGLLCGGDGVEGEPVALERDGRSAIVWLETGETKQAHSSGSDFSHGRALSRHLEGFSSAPSLHETAATATMQKPRSASPTPASSFSIKSPLEGRSGLGLYAAVGRSHRNSDGDTQLLIRDLRANLARRDTALNEAQMERSALQHTHQILETELGRLRGELLETKKQRDELQAQLTTREEEKEAQALQLGQLEQKLQSTQREKEEVQRRLTTAELLYEHAGPTGTNASLTPSDEGLREQLQLYRAKWQAAEDEMEHLHKRLSELQRQLVSSSGIEQESQGRSGEAPPRDRDSSSATEGIIEQAKHAAQLSTLRRQHQEQLQVHVEEVQRLQRRLERAQENATFHEDQLRQQRQEDSRQHGMEIKALQAQLRTAQGELVKAQEEREHLARQLRRTVEQETTAEVLRTQVDQLKQRLGEVGTELAQLRGREKESSLLTQRERLARTKAEHDAEVLQEALAQEKNESQYLREEIKMVREQLGMLEAASGAAADGYVGTSPALNHASSAATVQGGPQSRDRFDAPGRPWDTGGGDAAALSSELKGYAGLMRMNTVLQRRVEESERRLAALHPTKDSNNSVYGSLPPSTQSTAAARPEKTTFSITSQAEALPCPLTTDSKQREQVAQLEAELAVALQNHQRLMNAWLISEEERRQLLQDNQALADGVERLQRYLQRRHAKPFTSPTSSSAAHTDGVSPPSAAAATPPHVSWGLQSSTETGSHNCRTPHGTENRVRHRLDTARAQDHVAACSKLGGNVREVEVDAGPAGEQYRPACRPVGAPPLQAGPSPPAHHPAPPVKGECTCQEANVAAPPTLSAMTWFAGLEAALQTASSPPPSVASTAAPSPPAAATPTPSSHASTVLGSRNASDLQPYGSSSPSQQQRHHGSMLPPVRYPTLFTHSRDKDTPPPPRAM